MKGKNILCEFFVLISSFLYLIFSSTFFYQSSLKPMKPITFLPLLCLLSLYLLFSKCKNLGIFTTSLTWSFIYIGTFFQIKSILSKILSVLFLFTFPIFHYSLFFKTSLKMDERFNQRSIMFFAILSLIILAFHFRY